jgi:hypothetical protein
MPQCPPSTLRQSFIAGRASCFLSTCQQDYQASAWVRRKLSGGWFYRPDDTEKRERGRAFMLGYYTTKMALLTSGAGMEKALSPADYDAHITAAEKALWGKVSNADLDSYIAKGIACDSLWKDDYTVNPECEIDIRQFMQSLYSTESAAMSMIAVTSFEQ